jgi:hypothetical protein
MLTPVLPFTGAALTRFIVPPTRPAKAAVRTRELFDILMTESPFELSEFVPSIGCTIIHTQPPPAFFSS